MPSVESKHTNPYASPQAPDELDPAARIRAERRGEERKLKHDCLLLTAFFVVLSATAIVASLELFKVRNSVVLTIFTTVTTAMAVTSVVVYSGVRRMAAWSRVPLKVLSIFGLAYVPIGTVLGIVILRRLSGGRQPRLLTREYESLVGSTPEARKRTSMATWLVVILLVVLVAAIYLVAQLPPELRQPR